MTTYEYKDISFSYNAPSDNLPEGQPTKAEALFNEVGNAGWKLVSIYSDQWAVKHAIFMREK